MLFEHCRTTTEQGNIGEAAAILHFAKQDAIVCKPLFVNNKYDLIVDINNKLQRIQVKTTKQLNENGMYYTVNLKTSGCNARKHTYNPLDTTKVDLIYVLADDGAEWVIPASQLTAGSSMCLNERFDKFKV